MELFSKMPPAYLEQLPLVRDKYLRRVPAPARHENFLSVLTLACDMLNLKSPFDILADFGPYAVCVLAYAFRFVCSSSTAGWLSLVVDIFATPRVNKRRYVCVVDQQISWSWHTPNKRARQEEDDEDDEECRVQTKRVLAEAIVENVEQMCL